ncbi:MAG: response regulator, partial [Oscillospiraceae bacterium]|nr:response regulator [Oscillospiraceae bacterium]
VTVQSHGGLRICEMLLAVEVDQFGDALCKVVLLKDITEIEHKDDMLRAALDQAKNANKAKSDFLSSMSHEIRTPMNAIIGMTRIAEGTTDVSRKDYAIEKIKNASVHLLGVINDILDMSKIEADKFDLSTTRFNFEKMLRKIADVVNFRMDERRQRFYVGIDGDIPQMLIGDEQRLAQVITNLLSNAAKFTPEEGSIRLDARLISEENRICQIQVSVEDTGIGVTEEQKSRLFQSYEQASADTSRKFGGTGLGLAISKRIVEMMGGSIWVDSEPGKGSTFTFTAYLKNDSTEKEKLLEEGVNWRNLRIFAVDNDPEILKFFTSLFDMWDITCTVAANAEEAMEVMRGDDSYDIYFLDWKLPGMTGLELAKHIKRKAAQKSVVIIFSSTEWHEIEDEAKEAGISIFLPKPLFPSMIVDTVNECLGVESLMEGRQDEGLDADFTGYTILLAEDVDINREIVMTLLEPMNLAIDCAENGQQAFEMFLRNPLRYGMIFMDIQMPEMDGYEATTKIRALSHLWAKNIPIIAMTANVFREDVERCESVGMNGHVGKPLDFDEVVKQLRRYLH